MLSPPFARFWRSGAARWTIAAAVLVLAATAALSWLTRRRVYRTVASSEAMLDTAGLVRGAGVGRVLAVLDSMHLAHTQLDSAGSMYVRIGPSFQDFLVSGDIEATLAFDAAGRLVSRRLQERLTGP